MCTLRPSVKKTKSKGTQILSISFGSTSCLLRNICYFYGRFFDLLQRNEMFSMRNSLLLEKYLLPLVVLSDELALFERLNVHFQYFFKLTICRHLKERLLLVTAFFSNFVNVTGHDSLTELVFPINFCLRYQS